MDKKMHSYLAMLITLFAFSLVLSGCGGQSPQESSGGGDEASTTEAGDGGTAERTGDESTSVEDTGEETGEAGSGPGGPPETTEPKAEDGVTLRIGGKPDLKFSGTCTVDGEERKLRGSVPRNYTYDPQERLQCEVSNRQRGRLRVSLSDGKGTNAFQQVGPQTATVELTYTENSISTSTRSSSRTSSQSSQQDSSQSSSQSSSQNTQQSSSQSNSSSITSSQSSSQSSSSVTSPGESGSGGPGGSGGAGGSAGSE